MVQHKGALVILGVIKGTARDRLYQELGLEFLVDRRWSRRLFFFLQNYTGTFIILPLNLP